MSNPDELGRAADRLRMQPADVQLAAEHLTDWLGCLQMLDPSEWGGDKCGWCSGNHALDIARAVNGGRR